MRNDIAKVIVERARRGRQWCRKVPRVKTIGVGIAADEFADGGTVPLKRRDTEFNDYLSPLRRYLDKNVGRPWDKVFSEICAQVDRRAVQGRHVLQHVEQYVTLDCWSEGKRVVTNYRFIGTGEVYGFYVHPRTRILMRTRGRIRP